MANAGRVAIVPKGEYSATVAYKRLDLVRYNNDLYIAKKANTGVAPTDSETWMLSLENVSQTQYDDILNGTTAVGNAKKVNGHTIMTNEHLTTPINECASYTDLFSQIPENGTFIGYTWYAPSWFPLTIDSNWHVIVDKFSNASIEIRVFSTASVGLDYRATFAYGTTWSGWQHIGDGGNADTVDGYHASDFIKTGGRVSTLGFGGEYDLYTDIDGTKHSIPFGWTRDSLRADLAKYLPLDGSVPMSGSMLKINNDLTRVGGDSNHVGIATLNGASNESNHRSVIVKSQSYEASGTNAVIYRECVDGAMTDYTVLHTGNSHKVLSGDVAPTDTSGATIWIDTVNKVIKKYVDGAWTIVA